MTHTGPPRPDRLRPLILMNSASGKGGSNALGPRIAEALRAAGHEPASVPIGPAWEREAEGRNLIVACGGDGTVNAAASVALERDIPIYHIPRGTENLFAREFGMKPDAASLVRAIERWNVRRFDSGVCAGAGAHDRAFMLMCSVGFDADVLHALAARRSGPISHASYVRPVVSCLLRPSIRALRIEADGRTIVDGVRGNVVVSNCRRYALGIDPSPNASMTDGHLDMFFAPSSSSARTLAWLAIGLAGLTHLSRRIVRARAREIRISSSTSGNALHAFQLDGEAASLDRAHGPLVLSVRERALPVLLPA
ncbi:MAG: NAD(+)/NADH kinase [Phycisphaeraceae bacterium]|nr:MAG: NAD(+)/NADH kinase [Phycisphaeraceae bacterium]